MAIFSGDQQTINSVCINGQIVRQDAATFKVAVPAGHTTYTFTDNSAAIVRGAHMQFRKGLSYHLLAADVAALQATAAPMVAA
jgi:hypothetical protein